MEIIPRLKATTEDHAPMSIRGIQNTAPQRSSYHVSCHMSCYGVIVWQLCVALYFSDITPCLLHLTEQGLYVCVYYLHMCFTESSVSSYYDHYIQVS